MNISFAWGVLLALASAAIWALAPVLYRRCLDHVSSLELGALRTLGYLASAGLFLLAAEGPSAFELPSLPLLGAIFVSAVIWLVLGDLLYFLALPRLGVSIGVPFTSAYPLIAVPASWIFLGEPFRPIVFLATILIVAGLVILTLRLEEETPEKKAVAAGLLFAFGTICCWSFGIVTNRMLMAQVAIARLEWWRSVALTAVSWLLYLVGERRRKPLARVRGGVLFEILLSGVLGLTVGNLLFTFSMNYISVDVATCVASLRPFLAALFAFVVLGETLSLRKSAGIACVVIGALLLSV
ncbi:MAG: DMT family transporter [Synergistales bacterium]|nr:DMT family transporter [Synergistales bacterium]